MRSRATAQFWDCFDHLPVFIQSKARENFALWQKEPFHPSLHFKRIHENLWSARVTRSHRALARYDGDEFVWFWIGSHDEYDRLIR